MLRIRDISKSGCIAVSKSGRSPRRALSAASLAARHALHTCLAAESVSSSDNSTSAARSGWSSTFESAQSGNG
eukprot:6106095-Prymnesium_polylepis.1